MGGSLSRELVKLGHEVTVSSRRPHEAVEGIDFLLGNALENDFLQEVLSHKWDAIVDFMVRPTEEFRQVVPMFLSATDQYVFVSSYRVFADSPVLTEDSARLLDVVNDLDYLATDEYALAKARCEDALAMAGDNWTIVRPAVTYDGSVKRLQLGPMETSLWLWRALKGVPVPVPAGMLTKQATMTYGGDVARMIALLIGNPLAIGERFIVSTSDHMSWRDVANVYESVLPFSLIECDLDAYCRALGTQYQVRYDRMFDRVIDNSKVLKVTGLTDENLTPMRVGLARELGICLEAGDVSLAFGAGACGRLDRLTGGIGSMGEIARQFGPIGVAKYLFRRVLG